MKIFWGGLCGVAGSTAFLLGSKPIGFALCSACFILAAWGGIEKKAARLSAKQQVDG
ncbi:TPA: hypothetical protein SL557_000052 [Pseudomonas aeruginosa]|uniref:hypothetical protein n=1 Tax=Pseudomonas aeruginosa TaxID=287 RepID=UPI00159645B1|nr:hypothetical protein [Pseudomonas aeruginosa]HEJ4407775.1 hypothetical protein [Pseudomonas aeruginosa]